MPRTLAGHLVSAAAAMGLSAAACVQNAAAADLATSYVSPGGTGNCAASAPCGSLEQALRTSTAGGRILLATGSYPPQLIHDIGISDHFETNVVVEPAAGAQPVFTAITDYAPHITFANLRVDETAAPFCDTCGVKITSGATYSQLTNSRLIDATLSLFASHSAAIGNEIGPSHDHDGIDVGNRVTGITIRQNHVHDLFVGVASRNVHVDCLQIYDSSNLVVTANWFDNCTDRDLIFSPGQTSGVTNVVVENNFMRGCVTLPCQGSGYAIDARTAPGWWNLTNLSFVSNTVVDGGTLIAPNDPGLLFRDNILSFLANCMSVSDHNLIAAYNTGLCKSPAFLGSTNQIGALPSFVNRVGGDLHLTGADPRLRFAFQASEPTTDIDGFRRCQPSYVGAHDYCAHTLGSVNGQRPPSIAPHPHKAPPPVLDPARMPPSVAEAPPVHPIDERGVLLVLLVGIVLVAIGVAIGVVRRRGQSP